MKRIGRSRRGFTLVEITIVVAIIVILAAVSIFGVAATLRRSQHNADAVELHAGCWYKPLDNQDLTDEQKERYNFLNGQWVEVVPKGTPGAQYYSDWDEMYEQVRNINAVTPMPQGGGYTPGGSGGVNPGTGGSGGNPVDPGTGGGDNPGNNPGGNPGGGSSGGGDNPGGGAVNPVEPEDPMWNGHPESWWDEHDAEIEKKIQEAISKGVNPDDIKVTRDPETGHITNYVIPAAPNNSHTGTTVNNVNLPNGVQTDDHKAGAYEVKDLGGGKTQVGLQTNAWYRQNVTIEKQGNNYVLHVSGNNRYVLQGANHEYQNIWPNLDKDNQTYTLNKDQIECLKSFGINLI